MDNCYLVYILRDFRNSYPIIFLIIGISLQFMLGGDTTRFVSFMFLGLIFVVEKLKLDKFLFLNIFILFFKCMRNANRKRKITFLLMEK